MRTDARLGKIDTGADSKGCFLGECAFAFDVSEMPENKV